MSIFFWCAESLQFDSCKRDIFFLKTTKMARFFMVLTFTSKNSNLNLNMLIFLWFEPRKLQCVTEVWQIEKNINTIQYCRPSTCFWIVEYFDHSFDNHLETLIHKSFKTYLCSFYSQITYLFTFYWKYTYLVFHIFTYPWVSMTWYFSWGEREFSYFYQLFFTWLLFKAVQQYEILLLSTHLQNYCQVF